jgi:DNA-binding MarR family transcriptional regulator
MVRVAIEKETPISRKMRFLGRLAKTTDLNYEDHRVAEYLITKLDFEKDVHVPQRKIATLLEMHQPNVSRSIKRLIEAAFISEGKMIGSCKTYRLK